MQVNVHDAKTNLSRLLEAVERGEEVIIARAGKPAARLVAIPSGEAGKRREPGVWRGQLHIAADFDGLPDDIADAFGANG
jgi:prevent-host-death family protein